MCVPLPDLPTNQALYHHRLCVGWYFLCIGEYFAQGFR
jgi:hypothetical protein